MSSLALVRSSFRVVTLLLRASICWLTVAISVVFVSVVKQFPLARHFDVMTVAFELIWVSQEAFMFNG